MKPVKKIIVSVSSDLCTDQRVQKICKSLAKNGFEVELLGRKLKNSPKFCSKEYRHQRVRLWFNKGALFYANLNIRIFLKLLTSNATIFYSNDLDTLPANYLASKFKGIPLVYDSHEYFTEVPELINRPYVKAFWEKIEKLIVPKLRYCITVAENIATIYYSKFKVQFALVRNFPIYKKQNIPEKEDYIVYQGALNIGRGIEELINAMPTVNSKLWIAGGGDIELELKKQVQDLKLSDKVIFLGRLTPKELKCYTLRAKVGVSLEKDMGLNYRFALPNKIFDYLHCGTAVLYSDLIEVKNLLKDTPVGEKLVSYKPQNISNQLNGMLNSSLQKEWILNASILSEKLNWQNEEKKLLEVVNIAAHD